eukprot:3597656-Amphidinium_carterae.1
MMCLSCSVRIRGGVRHSNNMGSLKLLLFFSTFMARLARTQDWYSQQPGRMTKSKFKVLAAVSIKMA